MSTRYAKSEAFLERARRVIPLGAQTFSKSVTQYPLGVSPFFVVRGEGSKVWDVDGNEYVDFINALASVTLGYADPDINAAVKSQIDLGTIYSLSHPLETEVAEMICEMVPSAEMVRFGKNGSDATAGAVRISRAFTGRDHILTCGYHGWQDWYIGATPRNKGVPESTRALTHSVPYNDLKALDDALRDLNGKVAAMVMEPMNIAEPASGYLQAVKDRLHAAGALLVFDETVTGFRYANGGAQEFFDVTPDLTTLGKGIANGFPLSVVCGRRDVMMEMEEVFFSFTMGGETMSLAAAKAALTKLKREPVTATMSQRGARLKQEVSALIAKHEATGFLGISGHPTWTILSFSDSEGATSWEIKTLWLQEMLTRGILTIGSHNMSYAHSDADIDRLVTAYDEVLPLLRDAIRNKAISQYLKCPPLEPLFRIR
jgi:glutamate-1-semialdehyde 2,1-aminomutase